MTTKLDILKNVTLCRTLSGEERSILAAYLMRIRTAKGAYLVHRGQEGRVAALRAKIDRLVPLMGGSSVDSPVILPLGGTNAVA